uniref:Secreted protein n=1 Tax=Sarcocystis aucheniae TaxID=65407 RepID=A0A5P9S3P1_9APIC|nr:hypothetical protein [Sarcocystis aucheniae]
MCLLLVPSAAFLCANCHACLAAVAAAVQPRLCTKAAGAAAAAASYGLQHLFLTMCANLQYHVMQPQPLPDAASARFAAAAASSSLVASAVASPPPLKVAAAASLLSSLQLLLSDLFSL